MVYTVADYYGVVAESVTRQTDTITLSHTVPAALSRSGIISFPSTEVQGATPTADVIVVRDTTTSNTLVLGTDYTLTPSGAGETLTYTVTRINSSVNSADADTAKVTYLFGTTFNYDAGQGVAGTAPAGTAFKAATTDTGGAAAGGVGAAGGFGSLTDPAIKVSGSETGSPGSEYKAAPVAPNGFGWPAGVPDTEGVYGGQLPENFIPSSTSLTGTLDTIVGNGGALVSGLGTAPAYRAPSTGVAGGSKDTTLTDILGNQAAAPSVPSQSVYAASVVDTSYAGAPAQPSALSSQTDTLTTAQPATTYYLSQQGVVPASIVVKDTTATTTLVLGTDYAVTTAGNGAVTACYIVLTSGTNFTTGHNVSIAYSYGTPQYWDSNVPATPPGAPGTPTATAANRGVKLVFAPPAGIIPVDYYMVQSSDLGTQYVPALGQPMFGGQPGNASGGATVGQPTYQADTFTNLLAAALAAPAAPTLATATTGGTVLAGTYKVIVTYVNANGETVGSASASQVTTGSTSTITITSPTQPGGATGWYAYVTQVGGSVYTRQQAAGSPTNIATNLVLTAPPTSSGANPPVVNSTLPTTSKAGVITPAGQLVVRDITSAENDPMQPTGTVLEYGYDYTVNQIGVGPWTQYQIVLVTTSVNAKAGDTVIIEYQYGADPSSITTIFTQGLVENTPVIYKPDGTTPYSQGYQFRVAAGNRAGLGGYSGWSSFVVPLNYNAPQPGHEGATQTLLALDPANTVNPVYLPNGTIKSGTGLGG
jgi:hypothetical protein